MKIRNIPFGYKYENGIVVINEQERATILRICDAYLNGSSLLCIAEMLNDDGVEFSPGVIGWNKARIMRIISDERYLGTEKYPKIIEETTHTDLQEIRSHKNRQKAIDRASAIYKLSFPVICGKCGSVMRRKQDMRRNYLQKWTCTDSACAESVKINDEKLLQGITGILNELIAAPEQITCPNVHEAEADAKLLRLENEIGRTLEGCDFDRDALRERLLQRAALKYAKIGNEQHVFRTLTRLIQNAEHQTAFPSELANKVIRQISLKNSQEILVTLINGQELGREVADT